MPCNAQGAIAPLCHYTRVRGPGLPVHANFLRLRRATMHGWPVHERPNPVHERANPVRERPGPPVHRGLCTHTMRKIFSACGAPQCADAQPVHERLNPVHERRNPEREHPGPPVHGGHCTYALHENFSACGAPQSTGAQCTSAPSQCAIALLLCISPQKLPPAARRRSAPRGTTPKAQYTTRKSTVHGRVGS